MLIINPISGTMKKSGLDTKVVNRLKPAGFDVDVRFTERAGHATELAAEAAAGGYYGVIAAGGDGTINETACGLINTGVPMGIIPAGSGNGLARHIEIPIDFGKAIDIIAENNPVDVDYGTLNGAPYFCTMGVGFDAAVSHRFASQGKRGLMMYVKSMIELCRVYKPETYTLSFNGQTVTHRAFVIAVANASQYGNNAYVAPQASIRDGLLDVTIIHCDSLLDMGGIGLDLMTGYLDKNTHVTTFRTPAVTIYRNAEGPAHMDGEPRVLGEILDVKCHQGGLKMFVPKKKKPFRPIITPISSTTRNVGLGVRRMLHL